MTAYVAPLRDMEFVLYEVLETGKLADLPGCGGAARDTVLAVLDQAGKLCHEVLSPLCRSGDEEGCRFIDGRVETPSGFRDAYRVFAEGGWPSLACDPAHGGQGLPQLVNFAFTEMMCASNVAFALYVGLSYCVYRGLATVAPEPLRARFLPPLVDGRWSGTMCLTEPHCGSDLGLIRSTATADPDGIWRLTGTKIFISGGEHDLTENILHLVLARLPDAPAGTRGLSLFLVPKFLPDETDRPGSRNAVHCLGVERKMGLHGSATCTMRFEGAVAYLLSSPHQGLRAMFTVLNLARPAVGLQGLGIAEAAYQKARAYARERLQGRFIDGAIRPDLPADPILVHPDIRRMLLTIRALAEGGRAVSYWTAFAADLAAHSADAAARAEADDLVQLTTPILKAWLTDCGFEAANLAVQIFGGHGYIRENGVEKLVRDARIGQLYEGTNGIQALDLVARKLPTGYGRLLRRFFYPVERFIEAEKDDPAMAGFIVPLGRAVGLLQEATLWIAERGTVQRVDAAAGARAYATLFGLVLTAFMWARMARVALTRLEEEGDDPFYSAKCATARFFFAHLLPRAASLARAATAGSSSLMALDLDSY